MDIRIIVFGMCFVLAALFIGAKFFVPKEKDKSKKEAAFAQATQTFHKSPSPQTFQLCFQAARDLPHLQSKNEDEVNMFLNKNGIHL